MDYHQLLVQFVAMKAISLKNKRVTMKKYIRIVQYVQEISFISNKYSELTRR